MAPREGFHHNRLIVYAVQYELESTPSSWVIVWLDERGNSVSPWMRPVERYKRMVTAKPGDVILRHGKPQAATVTSTDRPCVG